LTNRMLHHNGARRHTPFIVDGAHGCTSFAATAKPSRRGVLHTPLSTLSLIIIIIATNIFSPILYAQNQPTNAQIVDSLFIRASSGEVQYRDLVQPAKDAIIEMGETAIPQMLAKLNTRDARETHTVVDIFKGIGEIAVDSLAKRINSRDDFTRRLAIRCLGEIKSQKAIASIIKVASHDDFRTRAGVMSALGKIGSSDGAFTVVSGLDDSDELVATAAAVACGRIREGISPKPLIRALSHRYYGVRYSAAGSLAKLGEIAVEPLIIQLQTEPCRLSTGYIIKTLGKIGSKKVISALKPMLSSDDWAIRASTAEAFGNIQNKKSKKILNKALKSETHPLVINQIKLSLDKLQANL